MRHDTSNENTAINTRMHIRRARAVINRDKDTPQKKNPLCISTSYKKLCTGVTVVGPESEDTLFQKMELPTRRLEIFVKCKSAV